MKNLETVKDIVELIIENANSNNQELAKHARTLQGPRKRGSTTDAGLEDISQGFKLEDVTQDCIEALSPGCKCYRFFANELCGKIGASPLNFYRDCDLDMIRVRMGEHGPELYVPSEGCDEFYPENYTYVIVGEFAGEQAVFTWHPGKPLAPLSPLTGVKLK